MAAQLQQQQQKQQSVRHKKKKKYFSCGHRPRYAGNRLLSALFLLLISLMQRASTQLIDDSSSYYYVGCYTERTDLLKETVYAKMPQTCIEICEHQTYSYAVLSAERCFCSNSLIASDRQDEQLCNTRCLANKAQYCGGVGVHSYYSTMLAKQPAPNHLKVANATEHSLVVTWEAYSPRKLYLDGGAEAPAAAPQISNFLIKSQVVQTYSSLPFFPQPEFIVQSSETRFEITDLHPATEYNVSVEAMCDAGQSVCGRATIRGITIVGQPNPEPSQPRVLIRTDTMMELEIPPIRNDNGPVSKLLIIVERVDDSLSQPFDTELLGNWQKAQDDGLPYYIAAELDYQHDEDSNRSRKFIVGDGRRYGRYTNPPLDKEMGHIHVSLGVVSSLNGNTKTLYTRSTHAQHTNGGMEDFIYATFDSGRESLIALTVTCVIFSTCLVLSVLTYFYLRYKTCQVRSVANRMRNTHEMTLQQPIIERENNGFVVEDELPTTENFKQQLNVLLEGLESNKRLPRNALRMNVNDVIAEGRYGEVITGAIVANSLPEGGSSDCQLHVLSLDELSGQDQAHLLRDFRNLTRLQRHEHILDFYGVSASADWFYFIFEHQTVSLKRRLIESRRAPNAAPVQRITALSEELVLQWIYEIASALDYLTRCKIVHRQLCSHSIYVTADAKLKVATFGPVPYVSNQKKVDLTRWLAPEALRYQHYSTKSDVWSFACVAWECCSLGATPYANISNSQLLLDALKSGSRPAQPSFVFHDLYQLLLNCWQMEPSERINFEDIAYGVRQLMTSPRHALCFDRAPEVPGNNVVDTLPYYLPMLEMLN